MGESKAFSKAAVAGSISTTHFCFISGVLASAHASKSWIHKPDRPNTEKQVSYGVKEVTNIDSRHLTVKMHFKMTYPDRTKYCTSFQQLLTIQVASLPRWLNLAGRGSSCRLDLHGGLFASLISDFASLHMLKHRLVRGIRKENPTPCASRHLSLSFLLVNFHGHLVKCYSVRNIANF